jgi:uncharacterized protein DUF6998
VKRSIQDLGPIIKQLYAARNALRVLFPELPFTLDGKLVGDIGEAIALQQFGMERLPEGTEGHDFRAPDGRLVQVKTTQAISPNRGVGLGLTIRSFEHLIVIQLTETGAYQILYDGPGTLIDEARRHRTTPSLTVGQLRRLNLKVKDSDRIIKST